MTLWLLEESRAGPSNNIFGRILIAITHNSSKLLRYTKRRVRYSLGYIVFGVDAWERFGEVCSGVKIGRPVFSLLFHLFLNSILFILFSFVNQYSY